MEWAIFARITAHPTAQSTVDSILNAVSEFQSGMDHSDDETVIVLRVLH